MKGIERIAPLFTTEKQLAFDRDFLSGWEHYDIWEEIEMGRTFAAPNEYVVKAEDVIYFNDAVGETDPLMVDAQAALAQSPTGSVIAHPIFLVAITFYCMGAKGAGTWLRTPGSRNPFQDIELYEPIFVGERITLTFTAEDRFVRRGKHYVTNLLEFRGTDNSLKARFHGTLILPPTREEVRRFVTA